MYYYPGPRNPDNLPAFPEVQGFGSTTPGGRGWQIIEVTNLNTDGPCSFRAACEASVSRIVLFRTGGTIHLKRDVIIHRYTANIAYVRYFRINLLNKLPA